MTPAEWLDKFASIIFTIWIVAICIRHFRSSLDRQRTASNLERHSAKLGRKIGDNTETEPRKSQPNSAFSDRRRNTRPSKRRRRLPRNGCSTRSTRKKAASTRLLPPLHQGNYTATQTGLRGNNLENGTTAYSNSLWEAFEEQDHIAKQCSDVDTLSALLEEESEELSLPATPPPEEAQLLGRKSSDEISVDVCLGNSSGGEQEFTTWKVRKKFRGVSQHNQFQLFHQKFSTAS